MRMLPTAMLLLVLGTTASVTAAADEPDVPPPQPPMPIFVWAPLPQPYAIPHCLPAPVVPSDEDSPPEVRIPYPALVALANDFDTNVERVRHLRKAAKHLRAAGIDLDALAVDVRGLLPAAAAAQPLQAAHEEELPCPTEEAVRPERVSQPEGAAQQVLLALKILELDENRLGELGLDRSQPEPNETPVSIKAVGHDAHLPQRIEALCNDGAARVLSAPTLVTVPGRPVRFQSGSEIPRWDKGPDGHLVQKRTDYIGTSVDCLPKVVDNGNLQLGIRYLHSELDPQHILVVEGKKLPGIRTTEFESCCEFKPGETLIFRGPTTKCSDQQQPCRMTTVVLVTAETVETMAAVPSAVLF